MLKNHTFCLKNILIAAGFGLSLPLFAFADNISSLPKQHTETLRFVLVNSRINCLRPDTVTLRFTHGEKDQPGQAVIDNSSSQLYSKIVVMKCDKSTPGIQKYTEQLTSNNRTIIDKNGDTLIINGTYNGTNSSGTWTSNKSCRGTFSSTIN